MPESIELNRLAADIVSRHRSWVRELRLEVTANGLVIRGQTATFYGKQMVLHEVLRRGLIVVANEIVVKDCLFGLAQV